MPIEYFSEGTRRYTHCVSCHRVVRDLLHDGVWRSPDGSIYCRDDVLHVPHTSEGELWESDDAE